MDREPIAQTTRVSLKRRVRFAHCFGALAGAIAAWKGRQGRYEWRMFSRCFMVLLVVAASALNAAETVQFSGYEWTVKEGHWGPGPNNFDPHNVSVDEQGRLHLKLTFRDGKWFGAEVISTQRLGFGRYQWQIIGRLDRLDDNVVLGLFNYPTPDVGADGTNEIDMEFGRWGKPEHLIGNYSVHPPQLKAPAGGHQYPITLEGDYTTHRFEWTARSVAFQSLHGHREPGDATAEITRYLFQPEEPERSIPQQPMTIRMNLWLYRGWPPKNGQEVEIVIRSFQFTPA